LLLCLALQSALGCATYSDHTEAARNFAHLGDYDGSRKDLEIADKQLELLDLGNTAIQGVASYFYSDSAGP